MTYTYMHTVHNIHIYAFHTVGRTCAAHMYMHNYTVIHIHTYMTYAYMHIVLYTTYTYMRFILLGARAQPKSKNSDSGGNICIYIMYIDICI